jgi:hypothetical protein
VDPFHGIPPYPRGLRYVFFIIRLILKNFLSILAQKREAAIFYTEKGKTGMKKPSGLLPPAAFL